MNFRMMKFDTYGFHKPMLRNASHLTNVFALMSGFLHKIKAPNDLD